MLNELRDLARSLERTGIVQEDLHPSFKPCKKSGLSFWVYLDQEGNIQDLAPIAREAVSMVRKWEKANGVSFPAFNILPLFEPESDDEKEKVKTIKKLLQKGSKVSPADIDAIISKSKTMWNGATGKKVNNCLSKTSIEVEKMLGDIPEKLSSVKELCKRAKLLSSDKIHHQLKGIVLEKLVEDPALAPDLIDILFFYTEEITTKNIQVILELRDWSSIGAEYPANNQEVQKWMNTRFLLSSGSKRGTVIKENDAYGENSLGKDEKFPSARLPVLGNVILRAMNKESPCQARYRMIDADSFPVGNNVRMKMKSALEWLSKEERKGRTWCDLSKRVNKSVLLFAYPTEMPEMAPELAGLFGNADEDGTDQDGSKFSAIAERVIGSLKGRTSGRPENEVRIFVLAKMDKARTKVLVSRRYKAEQIITSAEHWQKGCRNIPGIRIRQFGKNKGDTVWAEPLIPFPAELIWCLNTAWRRQGTYAEAVHGFSVNDALSLLLDEGYEVQRLATRAIDATVRNSSPLILAIGQENHFGRVFKVNQSYAKQPLLLPSILGLLLYKLGYMKGGFMNSQAFLVGRFLSLADQLHLKYCEHVRKNSIPPQLVGNALMPTALEEPVKALSMLSQRILPYQAWANTLKEGDDIGLVKYFLGQLGEVSDQLKGLDIPAQCADADKAQILLGYLARSEKTND